MRSHAPSALRRNLASRSALAVIVCALSGWGCGNSSGTSGAPASAQPSSSAAAPSASIAGSVASGAASSAAAGAKKPTPYKGPSGTLSGVVTTSGDPAPTVTHKYDKGCEAAAGTYGKAFRIGQDNTLADAIVSVTHYKGFVPAKSDKVEVTIKHCAYSTRSVALTDGQHLEVSNLDAMRSYIPHLDGARSPATIVAVPNGKPVMLYSRGRQRYWLRDQMGKPWMVAHVFHFPYSTTAVTKLDGRYQIEGIPVGPAKVNVVLPLADKKLKHMSKDIDIKEGANTIDLTMEFSLEKDFPAAAAAGSAKPDASAASSAKAPTK